MQNSFRHEKKWTRHAQGTKWIALLSQNCCIRGSNYCAKRSDIGRHIARDLKMYVNTFQTKMRQSWLFKYMHKLVVGSIAANRSGEDVV